MRNLGTRRGPASWRQPLAGSAIAVL